jgi:predicted ATPase
VGALPGGTVTFLFTDVEGSTRLLHELGAEGYAKRLAEHRRVLREAFDRHGGVEVDTQGDAFFVAFPTAPGALEAARKAQGELDLPVRMGLHTGTPLLTEEGYVGADVHRAARIASAGHGRQVLVSAATAALVDSGGLRDLGEHRLKDLSAPERIFQLGEGDFPPLKTLYRTNLPIPATQLLGREHELAEVRELLAREEARLLTLTGAGGSGKTRLALHAAGEVADAYPDGVWWVPLAPLVDPADVAPAAARALGGGGTLPELVDGRRLLLLLDNFEHVVEAAPELATVLAECPHADVLVTSRERLRLQGEHVYPVPVLERAEAQRLFVARACAAQPGFEPDELLDELCARLDDLPLALELAAARTSLLSTKQLLERLGDRLDVLRGGRDAETRQQTLRATIEWSHELLEPEERSMFAALSVFRGGWTLEAAEQVTDADLELMQSLVDKSLVRRWDSDRFGMLETIREFAAEHLRDSGSDEAIRRRHAQYFLELADSANLGLDSIGRGPQRHDLVLPDVDNIRAAIDWATAADPALGLQIAIAIENVWILDDPTEGLRRLRPLLDAARDADPLLRARGWRDYGGSLDMTGDIDAAEAAYRRSRELFAEAGNERGIAEADFRLGLVAGLRNDPDEARRLYEHALDAFRELGDDVGEAQVLGGLGVLLLEGGEPEGARELMEASLALGRKAGWAWWEALTLGNLSEAARAAGRGDEEMRLLREAIEAGSRIADRRHLIFMLAALSRVAAERGDVEEATTLWAAIEAEEQKGAIGRWPLVRETYAVLIPDEPRPERAFSLDEAVAYVLEKPT